MKKRSVLAMVMAMGMVMGLTVPASAAENYKIAWVDGNLANESNAICTDDAKAYAEENNVDFTLLDGQGSGENQVSQIETLIAQGVDCIIVQPYDAAACQVGVEAAIDADIPVLPSIPFPFHRLQCHPVQRMGRCCCLQLLSL